ncbi:c-type cytochrome [Archangium lansingense]|uniref:c-type cytochrome n=1 Tax=Archangium lansingense TaxID=2995310 RepID=UPI003B805FE2
MRPLTLPTLLALSLLTACEEKPAAPPPPAAAPVPAAPARTEIPTPDITLSTAAADIAKGQEVYAAKGCPACHKLGGGKLVGPDLKGVLSRREQEWVEKMILRPDIMVKEDALAKKLLAEHFTPMPNQGVDPEKELPLILAYLKSAE